MFLKRERTQSESRRRSGAPGLAALAAGASFILACALTIKAASPVKVDFSGASLGWLTNIQFGLDEASEIERTLASLSLSAPHLIEVAEASTHATNRAPAGLGRHPKVRRVVHRKKVAIRQRMKRDSSLAARTVESMSVAQAAPVLAQDPQADFRQMYRQMRIRFFASIGGRGTLATQVASHAPAAQPKAVVKTAKRAATVKKKAPKASRVTVAQDKRVTKPKSPFLVETAGPDLPAIALSKSFRGLSTDESGKLLVPLAERTGQKAPRDAALEAGFVAYDVFREQTEGTYRALAELTEKLFGTEERTDPRGMVAANQGAVQSPASSSTITVAGNRIIISKGASSSSSGYSSPSLGQVMVAMNSHAQDSSASDGMESRTGIQLEPEQEAKQGQDEEAGVAASSVGAVEAFEWKTPVPDTVVETIAEEGWRMVSAAKDHWPTLYWSPNWRNLGALISYNTVVALSKLADVEIREDTAIIFGKVPAGWMIESSDRSEKPVYVNASFQAVQDAASERYFALLNAAPRPQTLILKKEGSADTASIIVPALKGTATQADLTAVKLRTVGGFVLDTPVDSSAREAHPLQGVSVSVVSQPASVALSNADGSFKLSRVFSVGDFPLYLETWAAGGRRHRYRISPVGADELTLFRISSAQLSQWESEVPPGPGTDGAFIVGAVPGMIKKYGEGRLFPSVRSVLATEYTRGQTFTVSEEGSLRVEGDDGITGAPLDKSSPRFVSTRLPEGAAMVELEDNNRNIVWSQLLFTEPGVVSIVGPY